VTSPGYKRAPITEAVIEIRFTNPVTVKKLDKIYKKFSTSYLHHQDVKNIKVDLRLPGHQTGIPKAEFDQELGHRLSTTDMTELLVLWPSAFVVSQLAPYPGWDVFFQRFVRDWKIWKRSMGHPSVARIGVRYINRIDIPISGPIVEYEKFINVYPKLPDVLGPVNAYGVQAVLPIVDIGCKLTLNSAIVASPILDHASFVVDQDISKEVDAPQSDNAIYELLSEIRKRKNIIFEACITDSARELFQR
jgi:uncharacterized protein (TIGR04255 family)